MMSGPNLTRAFARNAAESAYPNLWRGLVAAWAPPGAPRHATRLWDYSGNGNHGTLRNGANWAPGKHGYALNFDGTDDDVIGDTPGKNFPVGNQSRTVACWIKSPGWSGDTGLLHWGTDGNFPVAANFHLVAGSTGVVLWGNGFGHGLLSASTLCNDNQWHSVIGVFDSSTNLASIFIDSRVEDTGNFDYTPNTAAGSSWKIAKFLSNSGAFQGKISQMLVYRRALSKFEIGLLAACRSPFAPKPWRFPIKKIGNNYSFSSLSI